MIIFGTRGVTYTKDQGKFFCPECNGHQEYRLKRVRRFFTLYFIPVIPLDLLGEYVECPHCGGTYRDDILSLEPGRDPRELHNELHRAMKRVMVQVLLADGAVDRVEVDTVLHICREVADSDVLDERTLRDEIAQAQHTGDDVTTALADVAGRLNDHGKEMVMRAACMVAHADRILDPRELDVLQQVADVLHMSPAHFRGVLSEVTEAN